MRSIYLLGKDTQEEWRLVEQLGGSPNKFFRATQRIAWGLTQPDLIRVDLLATTRKLVASHGSQFPAHLYAAWVWRARDPDRAQRSLDDARELATPDHPLLGLMPTEAEWRTESMPQRIVAIHPDRMWRVAYMFPMAGAPLLHNTVATVIKLGGDLAIVNPIAFEPAIAEQIRALGNVRWIITQGKAHSLFVEQTRLDFPGSIAIGTEGHLKHPPAAHLQLDGVLGTIELPDELAVLPIEGHLLEEVVLVDRPSKTLIVQDLFALSGAEHSFVARLYAFAWGLVDPLGYASFSLAMWQSMPTLHASLAVLRHQELAHVIGAHGTIAPRQGDIEYVHTAIDFARSIGTFGHRAMLARSFAAQPSFLRDLIVYLRSTKHQRGAQLR